MVNQRLVCSKVTSHLLEVNGTRYIILVSGGAGEIIWIASFKHIISFTLVVIVKTIIKVLRKQTERVISPRYASGRNAGVRFSKCSGIGSLTGDLASNILLFLTHGKTRRTNAVSHHHIMVTTG